MSTEPSYFAAGEEDPAERERLSLYERVEDPGTLRRLEARGVAAGWRCLEVGAGAGSVARWLAQRVGPTGRVVASDINTRFLRDLNIPNLEIRRHDIVNDDLEQGEYDLVHCRGLLPHLADMKRGFARMAAAVRPGGWLLIEEADYGLFSAVDPGHPLAESFNSVQRALIEAIQRSGKRDLFLGRRVRDLVEAAGFADVGNEGTVAIWRGGEPGARLHQVTSHVVAKLLVAAGLFPAERFAEIDPPFEDPTFSFVGHVRFAAWGRRASSTRPSPAAAARTAL